MCIIIIITIIIINNIFIITNIIGAGWGAPSCRVCICHDFVIFHDFVRIVQRGSWFIIIIIIYY